MKRYIAVPLRLSEDGKMPTKAVELAKVFHLEIKRTDEVEDVQIVSEPEITKVDYSSTYKPGHIWSLDITDEFVDMREDCVLRINQTLYLPKIKEKHLLRFRPRIDYYGDCNVEVLVGSKTVLSTKIRVEE